MSKLFQNGFISRVTMA